MARITGALALALSVWPVAAAADLELEIDLSCGASELELAARTSGGDRAEHEANFRWYADKLVGDEHIRGTHRSLGYERYETSLLRTLSADCRERRAGAGDRPLRLKVLEASQGAISPEFVDGLTIRCAALVAEAAERGGDEPEASLRIASESYITARLDAARLDAEQLERSVAVCATVHRQLAELAKQARE